MRLNVNHQLGTMCRSVDYLYDSPPLRFVRLKDRLNGGVSGFVGAQHAFGLRRKAHNESMRKVVLCFDTLSSHACAASRSFPSSIPACPA